MDYYELVILRDITERGLSSRRDIWQLKKREKRKERTKKEFHSPKDSQAAAVFPAVEFPSWKTIYTFKGVKPTTRTVVPFFPSPLLSSFSHGASEPRASPFYTEKIAADKLANRSRDFKSPFRWLRRDSSVPVLFLSSSLCSFYPIFPPPYSFFPLFSFHSPVSRILRFKVERIELAPRLVRLRARKYSRKCPSSRGIPARIDPSFCLHFRSTKFPSLRKFRESKQFSKIPDIVSVYELLILAPILPRCQSSNEGQRLQKWRERDQDRATTLFVPIYGVSWGHDSRRGSRLGCFFHPRHLPSRYLFKVNGTGLVSQVCPKTGGFCPDLDGFASDHPFRNFYVSPFQPVT